MSARKIYVCHIISADVWAGAEVQAFTLIKGLHDLDNVNVRVITFNKGIFSSLLINEGVQLNIFPESDNGLLLMWRVYKILKNERIDVIHAHGYKENFIGGIVSRLLNIKLIRTHHGRGVMTRGAIHRFVEKINERYLADGIVSVSNELKSFLTKHAFNENKISVIHNGIKKTTVKPSVDEKTIREQLNISDNVCVIGTIGRMAPAKGHKYLLEAVSDVIRENNNVIFVVLGDGPLMDETKQYAKHLGVSNHVIFLGFRKDAIDILNIFDVFILTSIHEGIPIVLLEAMCLGKPIITTSVGGIPEVIKDNYNGLLVSAKNSDEISESCTILIENSVLRKKLSCNAINDVVEKHSLDRTIMKTESIYRKSI